MQRGEASTLAASAKSARERAAWSAMPTKAAGARNSFGAFASGCDRAMLAQRPAAARNVKARRVIRMVGVRAVHSGNAWNP